MLSEPGVPEQVGDLVYITDYSSSREDIVEMEKCALLPPSSSLTARALALSSLPHVQMHPALLHESARLLLALPAARNHCRLLLPLSRERALRPFLPLEITRAAPCLHESAP